MSLIYPGGDEQVTPNLGLATWGMDEVLAQNMILIDAAVSASGSVVKVNGVTELLANFNNTTPVAPGGATNVLWQVDGSGNVSAYVSTSGVGSVTSVAMTGDGIIFNTTVGGSPITTSGTLIPALLTQVANRVLAGPTSGGAATPTFRALVAGDIPTLAYVTSVALTMPAIFSVGGSPITSSGTLAVSLTTETANTVWAGPTTGAAATPTFRSLVAADLPAGTGTVTSFSAGNLSPLFTTNVGTPTTTPSLTFSLSNAGGGTVFGNNTTSAAAPAYTIAPVLGIPGTSTGTIALASSTASGLYTLTAPANSATPTLTLPTTSNVLAGQLAGDNTIFATTLIPASAAGTLTLPTPKNQTANTVFAGPSSGAAAAPTFRALVDADSPVNTPPTGAGFWSWTYYNQTTVLATATSRTLMSTVLQGNGANTTVGFLMYIPENITIGQLTYEMSTVVAGGTFDVGLYKAAGGANSLVASTGGITTNTGGANVVTKVALTQGTVTIARGWYYFAITSSTVTTLAILCWPNITTNINDLASIFNAGGSNLVFNTTSTSGTLPTTMPTWTKATTTSTNFFIPIVYFCK